MFDRYKRTTEICKIPRYIGGDVAYPVTSRTTPPGEQTNTYVSPRMPAYAPALEQSETIEMGISMFRKLYAPTTGACCQWSIEFTRLLWNRLNDEQS